jgi:hypothetical protein
MKSIADIIYLLHILYILFIILTPFSNSNYFLVLHVITIPFMLLHWILNDDTCALTLIEKQLRRDTNNNNCFTYQLISPIYNFTNNYHTFSKSIYVIVLILWFLSIKKLYNKYKLKEITTFKDLARL